MCMTSERHLYFNLPEVQKALHANRTNLPYSWSMCSEYVYININDLYVFSISSLPQEYLLFDFLLPDSLLDYKEADGDRDILPLLKRIIHHHIPVWVFRFIFIFLVFPHELKLGRKELK